MGIEHTFLSSTFVLLEAFFRINVEHSDPQEGLENAITDPEDGFEKAKTDPEESCKKAKTDPEEGCEKTKTDPEEGLEKPEMSTTKRYDNCPCYHCTLTSINI